MDTDPDADLSAAASQAASHFPLLLQPASGATLFDLEVARRAKLERQGRLWIGCPEIDDATLLGGFERGTVVGVSAEREGFGLLVGLQTIAHAVVFGTKQRAAIITTVSAATLLPSLRKIITTQVKAKIGPAADSQQETVNKEVWRCLEQISISYVFDVQGLWEVINEIETPPPPLAIPDAASQRGREQEEDARGSTTKDSDVLPAKPHTLPPLRPGREGGEPVVNPPPKPDTRAERTEIGDSEEEDEELSLASSPSPPPQSLSPSAQQSPSPPPPTPLPMPTESTSTSPPKPVDKQQDDSQHHMPDIILITHFSRLLTHLFTSSGENKASAHTTLQLLSSHLRSLARSPSGPLIMLLNSITTAGPRVSTADPANLADRAQGPRNRALEPTLRSIFTSASPPPPLGADAGVGGGGGGSSSRQQKPAFGATFAQFLDLHLLCTQLPQTHADAEALARQRVSTIGTGINPEARSVVFGWVVEVLLDELGVWEWSDDDGRKDAGKGKRGEKDKGVGERKWTRRSREQRWGAVTVRDAGVRIVDAFSAATQGLQPVKGPVRLAAGFGGPPPRGL
ncbi:hypothetical protein F5Y04DRAFT_206895 [Hypomontagnella monticulosa]|nr:hypothetical protein F5Y04DRAFT_206895 [Hypomontagnella monticulosa]